MSTPHHLLIRGVIPMVLLIPLLFGYLVSPLAAQSDPRALDPSDVFFQAWLEIQKAEKLEEKGEFSNAWQKYRQAAKYYDILSRYHKNWKPHLVNGRIESTKGAIKSIEPKAAAELAGKNAKTKDLVEAGPAKPNVALNRNNAGSGHQRNNARPSTPPSTASRIPAPPQTTAKVTPKAAPKPAPRTTTPKATRVSAADAQQQARLSRLERENKTMRSELSRLKAAKQGNPAEQQRLIDLIAKRDKEISYMRDLLARAPLRKDMDAANAKVRTREYELKITARALKESERKRQEAEKIADKHKAELELATKEHARIQAQMQAVNQGNNKAIRALRNDLKSVTALLEKTRKELGIANSKVATMQRLLDESQAAVKELTRERNELRVERDALANILKKNDSQGIQKLIAENMRLGRELKAAEDRLKFLESTHNITKDELIEARSDLAIAKTRIMRYQQEQADHSRMVRSLESQLRDAKAALADAQLHPDQVAKREEIETLRATVKRLITAQERRRMGEKILWETHLKSASPDEGMTKVIRDVMNIKVELSDKEKQLVATRRPDGEFSTPERVPLAHAQAHGNALASEINYVHGLVKRHVEKDRVELARGSLLDLNERVPGNVKTLLWLGAMDIKSELFQDAVRHLDEAITMQENNSHAHYMLGMAQYKTTDLDNARNSLERALHLKPDNAEAHLLLGNIAGAGRRYEQAQKHFLKTIELDPTQPDAYYNLSVLYLMQKKKSTAREYYRKALEHGAEPDPNHEVRLQK